MEKSILDLLVKELSAKFKDGLSPTSPLTPNYSGPGGLFGVEGLEQDLFSTVVHPVGIGSSLPAVGTNRMVPLVPYIVGFDGDTGDEKEDTCDDAPVGGPARTCIQIAKFGRYERATRPYDVSLAGAQQDRGEYQDLMLVNNPLLDMMGNTTPNVGGNFSLMREMYMRMLEMGVSFQRKLNKQIYVGNPANDSVGGGYEEFPGLDILISAGDKIDAINQVLCPSLDSDIKDFGDDPVDTGGGLKIVNYLTYMMRILRSRADSMYFSPVTWKIVMRETLFYEITAVWPCAYMTYRCDTSLVDGNPVVMASDQIAMRDNMRNGRYLTCDGVNYPVEFDSAITEEETEPGWFESDIYIVPMTMRGGRPVTYWEYFDYSRAMENITLSDYQNSFFSDGGKWLWWRKPNTNTCIQMQAMIRPRIRMLATQLAGKLINVTYNPLQHPYDPYPDDPYFVLGGNAARPVRTTYAEWDQQDG